MRRDDLIFLARLRLIVGYLGERSQYGWWKCSFFSPSSKSFLVPVFGKTFFLAQYHGVKEAAMKVHDNYIGIGRGVFHLFRLPETIEQELHVLLYDSAVVNQLSGDIADMTAALRALELYGDKSIDPAVGPVRIGSLDDLKEIGSWQVAAQYYKYAFETNDRVYPFFIEG